MIDHVLADTNEVITSNYSYDHKALDLVGDGHSIKDVIAYDSGVVEIVVNNYKGPNHRLKGTPSYGNFIKIRHPDGKKTLYAHLKYGSITVFPGQWINKGQRLAVMGNTGNAYGIHLHFEMRQSNEVNENPYNYLWGQPVVYLSNAYYQGGSIIDGLRGIGIDSSFSYRALLAQTNGIYNYQGTYSQNVNLLNLLKQGQLKKA